MSGEASERGHLSSRKTRFAASPASRLMLAVVTLTLVFVTAFASHPSAATTQVVEGGDRIDQGYHDSYGEARQALHEQILGDFINKGQVGAPPRLIFTAGPFGVGKSSLLNELDRLGLIDREQFLVIDMDEIRKRLPEFIHYARENPETAASRVQKETGYLAELLLWRAIRRGKNVILDSSLGNAQFFQKLLSEILTEKPTYRGHVSLIHVSAQLETIKARVRERNRHDLRTTPEADVRMSFIRDQQSYPRMKPLVDNVIEVDMSFEQPRILGVKSPEGEISGLTLSLAEAAEKLQGNEQMPPGSPIGTATPAIDSFTRLASLPSLAARPTNRGYDIVIDLDWTMFYTLDKPHSIPRDEVLEWRTEKGIEYYRATDHAAWLIEALISEPGVRVNFFSGGEKSRNEFLLRSIKLSDGRSAYDVATHVFNREDLTPVSDDTNLRFDARMKKRLQGLIRALDVTRTLMFDDQPGFATEGVKAVHAHGEHRYRPSFDPHLIGQPYEAPSATAYRRERNKVLMFYAIAIEALRADREGRAEFAAYAESLAKNAATGEWLPLLSPLLNRFFSIGESALRNNPTPLQTRPQKGTTYVPRAAEVAPVLRLCLAHFAS